MATDFVDLGRLPTIINDLSKWGVESKVQQKSISAQLASMRKEFDMMSKSTNSRLRDIDLGMKKLNDAGHEQAKLSSALEESLKSMDSLIEKATENNRSLKVLQGKVGGFESTLAEMNAQIKESQRAVALSEGFKEASNVLEGGGPVFPPLPVAYRHYVHLPQPLLPTSASLVSSVHGHDSTSQCERLMQRMEQQGELSALEDDTVMPKPSTLNPKP